MNNIVESDNDIKKIQVGHVVTLRHNPNQLYVVIDARRKWHEHDESCPNPVTLLTTDQTGRPHIVTVSVFCLTYG